MCVRALSKWWHEIKCIFRWNNKNKHNLNAFEHKRHGFSPLRLKGRNRSGFGDCVNLNRCYNSVAFAPFTTMLTSCSLSSNILPWVRVCVVVFEPAYYRLVSEVSGFWRPSAWTPPSPLSSPRAHTHHTPQPPAASILPRPWIYTYILFYTTQ